MTRFADDGYDENFPNEGALFWANADRALKGRKGKEALAELRDVLVDLPEPKLISGRLADEKGDVCLVGALAVSRRVAAGEQRSVVLEELAKEIPEDENCDGAQVTAMVGKSVGLTYMLAYRLTYANDEDAAHWRATPEERYTSVMRWIDRELGLVSA